MKDTMAESLEKVRILVAQRDALLEQRDILKKELEDGYNSALISFFIYLVQRGIAAEGWNPETLVYDYLHRDDNYPDQYR